MQPIEKREIGEAKNRRYGEAARAALGRFPKSTFFVAPLRRFWAKPREKNQIPYCAGLQRQFELVSVKRIAGLSQAK